MQAHRKRRPSGYVYRRESRRGAKWYAKYRLPNGDRQNRLLGPAWTGRGRPPAGYFTKRLAEDWLRDTLDELRFSAGFAASRPLEAGRGELRTPDGALATADAGVTFTEAAEEYLRFSEE